MILQSENWQLNFVVNVNENDVAVAFDQVHNTVTFDVYCFFIASAQQCSAAQLNSMCTQCAVFVFLFNFNLTLIIQ